MDLATVVGLIGGFIVVGLAIVFGGGALIFVNIPSALIVIVGSMFVVGMKFSIVKLKGAFGIAMKAFFWKATPPEELITTALSLAKIARKDGLLKLEEVEIEDPFFARGIQLVVDGTDADIAQAMLNHERMNTLNRHEEGKNIFMAINDVAPAMGMIGTLIGLVKMLSNMEDVNTIGPAMAVALLTTLYGAVMANMVAKPIADKLSMRSEEEDIAQSIVVDSVVGIAKGHSSYVLEQTLVSYLPSKDRANLSGGTEGASEDAAA